MLHQATELFFVIGKASAGAAESKRRPQDHRIPDMFCDLQPLVYGRCRIGRERRFAERFTQLFELFPVLGLLDGACWSAQKLYPALPQDTLAHKLNGEIQSGLTSDTGKDRVRSFVPYDLCHVFQSQRFHIHFVRNGGIGHDCRGIGIAQDHLVPLFLESKASLRPGIIEFRRLTDHDGAGADHQDSADIISLWHDIPPSAS